MGQGVLVIAGAPVWRKGLLAWDCFLVGVLAVAAMCLWRSRPLRVWALLFAVRSLSLFPRCPEAGRVLAMSRGQWCCLFPIIRTALCAVRLSCACKFVFSVISS